MTEIAIRARGLSRSFGALKAVDQLDLTVAKASIYGFLGPNGCGKSTTIRMLCGLLTPTAGEAQVIGFNLPAEAESLKRHIGYMTQKFSLYEDLSPEENLRFMAQVYGLDKHQSKSRVETLLSTYDLQKLRRQRAGSMSGGQRQRLALASAVLHEPSLLFLDEPTAAVDPENRREFWEQLFELCDRGTTILVSTHYMDEAERCHELAILEQGQLRAQGTPTQLMTEMPASVVELTGPDLRELKDSLLENGKVRSVAQQGVRLRVLVDSSVADPVGYVQQLVSAGSYECVAAHPSLEDVFVSVTGGARR